MPNTEQVRFQTGVCYIESQGVLKTPESTLKLNLSEQYILSYLIDNHGKPITKDELLHIGWPDRIVTEASLFQVIRALRVKLQEEKKGDVIETLPRVGYQIRDYIRETVDVTDPPSTSSIQYASVKTLLLSAISLGIVAAGISWFKYAPSEGPIHYLIDKDHYGNTDLTFIAKSAEDLSDLQHRVKSLLQKEKEAHAHTTTKKMVFITKIDDFYSAAWCSLAENNECIEGSSYNYKVAQNEWDRFMTLYINNVNQNQRHPSPEMVNNNTQKPSVIAQTSYIDASGINSKTVQYFISKSHKEGIYDFSIMSFSRNKDNEYYALVMAASKVSTEKKHSQFLKTMKLTHEMIHRTYANNPYGEKQQSIALNISDTIEYSFQNLEPFYHYLIYKQPHLLLIMSEASGFFWGYSTGNVNEEFYSSTKKSPSLHH